MASVVLRNEGDLLELRLDIDPSQNIPPNAILTLRDRTQGGYFAGSETERLLTLKKLSKLKPAYIDIESHVPQGFIEELDAPVILSYHDFEKTPGDLDALYAKLKQKPAALYKIATYANSSLDTLRMLHFIQRSDKKVIGISMGPLGTPGRILGPIVGNPMTYAYDKKPTAPGQLSASTLLNLYRFRHISPSTSIYGLIGDPIETSISEYTHNPLLQALGHDAVYVKFCVKKEEVHTFIELAKTLPFKGLSVTMPLKETLFDHPINTLAFDSTLSGINTDGIGACDAIETKMPLQGKQAVLLGTGGAAKAIAAEIVHRGGKATLISRPFLHLPPYDILINCTPADLPVDPHPGALIMDIKTLPTLSPLLQAALAKGCPIIQGYEMFIEQAVHQFSFWFPPNPLTLPTLRSLTKNHLQTV